MIKNVIFVQRPRVLRLEFKQDFEQSKISLIKLAGLKSENYGYI